jgi:hypothetical protein
MKAQILDITKAELDHVRKLKNRFPLKTRQVVAVVREGVKIGHFSFEEIGSSEEELVELEKKAGLVK